jgi:hypothetical protein
LVEYTDGDAPVRVSVPTRSVEKNAEGLSEVSEEILGIAIPYGAPFEQKLGTFVILPKDIADELHRNGIWTYEDYIDHPQEVHGAMTTLTRPIMQAISVLIKENAHK